MKPGYPYGFYQSERSLFLYCNKTISKLNSNNKFEELKGIPKTCLHISFINEKDVNSITIGHYDDPYVFNITDIDLLSKTKTKNSTINSAFSFKSGTFNKLNQGYILNNVGLINYIDNGSSTLLKLPFELGNKNTVYLGQNGDLWVGSFGKIFNYNTSQEIWHSIYIGDKKEDNFVNAMFIDKSGDFWTLGFNNITQFKKDGTKIQLREIDGSPLLRLTAINQDKDGKIWVGSGAEKNSTYCYDGKNWKRIGEKEGFTNNCVHKIEKGPNGELYFLVFLNNNGNAIGEGFYVFNNGKFTYPPVNNLLPINRFYAAQKAKDGTLWLGGIGALISVKNGNFKLFNEVDSLPIGRIIDLYLDANDSLYIYLNPKGLCKLTGETIESIKATQPLDAKRSYARIGIDENKIVWHTGAEGLFAYTNSTFYSISPSSGLKTQTNWPILIKDSLLYLGTAGEGVQVFNLNILKRDLVKLEIEQPIINNQEITIQWNANSYHKYLPDEYLIAYKIDEEEWSEWINQKTFKIENLDYGKHTLTLKVKGCFPLNNYPIEKISFKIDYPYYFQPFFVFPLLILLTALAYLSWRFINAKQQNIRLLKSNEKRLASYLESMPFQSMIVDQYGKCYESYLPLEYSIKSKTIFDTSANLHTFIPNENFRLYEEQFLRCIQQNEITIMRFEKTFDEEIRHFELRLSPYKGISKITKICIGVLIDISDEKKIENELRLAKSLAEQANQTKMNFLSNMSHEIRTPMNAIVGITDILLKENPTTTQKENLNIIRQSSENLLLIINDILDFSKIDAGKIELEKINFNLHELLDHLVSIFEKKAINGGLNFKYCLNPIVPKFILGDPTRLNQILINLLGNAIKFTENGSVIMTVESEIIGENKHKISFSIKDSGIGIAPENQNKIFELFTQESKRIVRKFGGTGLGLTITKHLVDLFQGEIKLKSSPGMGSNFIVEIPFEIGNFTEKIALENTNSHDITNTKILVAEDNLINQKVIRMILEKMGVTVVIANHGMEAISLLRDNDFDLILMDIQMPILDGIETTIKIRKMEGIKSKIPIIALTADAYPEIREQSLKAGMDDYISKPFKNEILRQKISQLINKN
ncbi:MAG: response regulator [Bacteroidia bacterium]|nr:response regulator [Bacteroidia bacterium]MCF8445490.1 response regulator [Bacteroidia bacterium]